MIALLTFRVAGHDFLNHKVTGKMIPIAKPYLTEDEAKSAYDTILSGWVTQGPRVEEFERNFCDYTGAKYAVAVSNCTSALHLSMIVAGINPGDEVICPSMSYIASANAIRYAGAVPVFAEIDPDTCNIDSKNSEKLITKKTKAILIVHQIGLPADIDSFKSICENHKLKLIEDAACAVGSSYKSRKIGSHSDLVCFSFHPRKVITTGEGGMITTSSEEYYSRLRILRQHGMSVNTIDRHKSKKLMFEEHVEVGYNYRMTDFQAAIGITQLKKLDWIIEERRKIAVKYIEELKHLDNIKLPVEKEGYFSNYQSFSIYLKKGFPVTRDELMQKFFDAGISTRRGVMTSHREMPYNSQNLILPLSEDVSDKSILLPLYVPMCKEEIECVIDIIRSV